MFDSHIVGGTLNKSDTLRCRRYSFVIFFAVLLMYLVLPTKNYYWDGIGLSYDVEHAESRPLLHQNHLLYGPLAHVAWHANHALFPGVQALGLLQVINAFFGAATVAVFYRALLYIFDSSYLATCLSLALAFSATWWKFSTDVDSYVPSIFFLVLGLLLVSPGRNAKPIALGCIHACGMLLHQLAALFAPVLILALWQQKANQTSLQKVAAIARYAITASIITVAMYSAAFVAHFGTFHLPSLLRWVTSHSQDVSFSFAIGENLVTSVVGHIKLVLGGRVPLIRAVWDPFLALTTAALIALATLLVLRLRSGGKLNVGNGYSHATWMASIWIGIYFAFLLVWLPRNTFYRLFYLPGLLILLGTFIAGTRKRHYRLALAVAALFFWNLGFHIYPYAQPAANPTLQNAQALQTIWSPGTIVYWDVYAADNRTIQYFNPQVKWKELWGRAWVGDIQQTMDAASAAGKGLWFDLPALERFAAEDHEFQAWLATNCQLGSKYEFTNGNHRTGFVQLIPKRLSVHQ